MARGYKRRTIVVDRPYQYGFVIRLLPLVVLGTALYIAGFYLLAQDVLSMTYAHYDLQIENTAHLLLPELLAVSLLALVLTGGLVVGATLVASHRLAGPVYRFIKSVEEFRAGNLGLRITLRKKDNGRELAAQLNAMAQEYGDRLNRARETVDRASDLARNLGGEDPSTVSRTAEELQKTLDDLRDTLSFFTTTGR